MTDRDDAERPTEGVRIIGAEEAAEAADRADTVRRRRGKRYGDRPDSPAPASDLPKITISTSESDDDSPDRFGAVPVVRPDMPRPDEPRWAADAGGSPAPGAGFGHARIVEDAAGPVPDEAPPPEVSDRDEVPPPEVSDRSEGHADEPTRALPVEGSSEPEPEPGPAPGTGPGARVAAAPDSSASDPWAEPSGGPEWSDEPTQAWSIHDESVPDDDDPDLHTDDPEPRGAAMTWSDHPDGAGDHEAPADHEPAADHEAPDASTEHATPDPWDGPASSDADEPVFSFETGAGTSGEDGFGESDDSFVLPHWTEPPTGQVPKVVVGEDAEEPEPLATYGSQPRWRDQGERSTVDRFDDLADGGPALGALGPSDEGDDHDDHDFFRDDPFGDAGHLEDDRTEVDPEGYDDHDDDYDDEPAAVVDSRRPRRAARPGGSGSGSGGGDRNLATAVAVGVGLVAVALLCFWLGTLTTALLATLVVGAAAVEYYTAVREAGHNPATLLGAVAVAGLMIATAVGGLAAYPVVLGLTILAGLLWYLWVAPGDGAVSNLGLTLLGVLWIGVLGSFSTLFLGLGRVAQDAADLASNPGIGVFLAAAIAAVSHDVGAYFVGKYLGRTPLSATSPNKTQEGLAGGVLASLVVTFVVVGLIGIEPIGGALGEAFIFALLCALVAPLGDLCESLIKRDLGIKDMGSVLPGHGGVLDRFDALLFVLPVAYFVTVLFDTWSTVGA